MRAHKIIFAPWSLNLRDQKCESQKKNLFVRFNKRISISLYICKVPEKYSHTPRMVVLSEIESRSLKVKHFYKVTFGLKRSTESVETTPSDLTTMLPLSHFCAAFHACLGSMSC